MPTIENSLNRKVQKAIRTNNGYSGQNLKWLYNNYHPYVFMTLQDDIDVISTVATGLQSLAQNRRMILADRDKLLIMAILNRPGSLYETLCTLQEREISYAHFAVSEGPLPDSPHQLEIQRFEFDRKSPREVAQSGSDGCPAGIRRKVAAALKQCYPEFDHAGFDDLLHILWLNNQSYVRTSPAVRVARILWLYQQAIRHDGIHLDVEEAERSDGGSEARLMFAVGNPPQRDFLLQVMEIFNRLAVSVKRAYCLTISNKIHPYFLGTFYVTTRDGKLVTKDSELFAKLKQELYATQILSTASASYRDTGDQWCHERRRCSAGRCLYRLLPHESGAYPPGNLRPGRDNEGFPQPSRHCTASGQTFQGAFRSTGV